MLVGEAGDVEPAAQLVRWGSRPHSVRFTERTVFSSLGNFSEQLEGGFGQLLFISVENMSERLASRQAAKRG